MKNFNIELSETISRRYRIETAIETFEELKKVSVLTVQLLNGNNFVIPELGASNRVLQKLLTKCVFILTEIEKETNQKYSSDN